MASTIDHELNSSRDNEMTAMPDDDQARPDDGTWAGINFNFLYKHLNTGINEQTHPWDPIPGCSSHLPGQASEAGEPPSKQKTQSYAVSTRHSSRHENAMGTYGTSQEPEKGHIMLCLKTPETKKGDRQSTDDDSDKAQKVACGDPSTTPP